MFQNVSESSHPVASGAEKHPRKVSGGQPRSSARRLLGQPERGARHPPLVLVVRVVGELEELGVALHHLAPAAHGSDFIRRGSSAILIDWNEDFPQGDHRSGLGFQTLVVIGEELDEIVARKRGHRDP